MAGISDEWIDDVEDLEEYRKGGNHPSIQAMSRYRVVHKLGYDSHSTDMRRSRLSPPIAKFLVGKKSSFRRHSINSISRARTVIIGPSLSEMLDLHYCGIFHRKSAKK